MTLEKFSGLAKFLEAATAEANAKAELEAARAHAVEAQVEAVQAQAVQAQEAQPQGAATATTPKPTQQPTEVFEEVTIFVTFNVNSHKYFEYATF